MRMSVYAISKSLRILQVSIILTKPGKIDFVQTQTLSLSVCHIFLLFFVVNRYLLFIFVRGALPLFTGALLNKLQTFL